MITYVKGSCALFSLFLFYFFFSLLDYLILHVNNTEEISFISTKSMLISCDLGKYTLF